MKAVIKTNDRNLFYALLQFLKSIHVKVETVDASEKEPKGSKVFEKEPKKFNPQEYKGILSHLNLDIEKDLQNMRNAWKKRNF